MDRRDFMKYFGIGATIVPLVAGMPKTDAAATLIEVPKAKQIEVAQSIPSAFPLRPFIGSKLRMQVNFLDEQGKLFSFEADTFLTAIDRIDITSWEDHPYRRYIPGQMRWDMTGIVVGEYSNIQRAHELDGKLISPSLESADRKRQKPNLRLRDKRIEDLLSTSR